MGEIKLTELQETAKNKIVNWFKNYKDKNQQTFVLAGYAGTGKTFLVNHIINDILKLETDQVAFVAPTGKAANVLIQRGATGATTIHRLIYNIVEKEYETKVNGEVVKSKKYEFVRVTSLMNYKLIVVDETSMVESKIMKDLLSFGIPVLCCGDPFQLPPVGGQSNGLLENPDVVLTEIMRQDSDNSIVILANEIRNGGSLKVGCYGDVTVVAESNIGPQRREYLLTKCDQVICGTNRRRAKLNEEIKNYLGLKNGVLNEDEKIICLMNNWGEPIDDNERYYLVNGMMGTCHGVNLLEKTENKIGTLRFKPDFLDCSTRNLVFDNGNFARNENYFEFRDSVCLMSDGTYEFAKKIEKGFSRNDLLGYIRQKRGMILKENINFFDSAYAISCHKSQGAEWNNVVVFDESKCFGDDWRRWLYTAITRARKKLVIIL